MGTDARHPDAWVRELRIRFLEVARRRVPGEDAEDLVQDAMRVIHEKGPALAEERDVDGSPPVAWCFQVLRFTIGNYYKRTAFRGRFHDSAADPEAEANRGPHATPVESYESEEALGLIEGALSDLSQSDPRCAGYLGRIVDGKSPRDLAEEDGLTAAVLYRRVYRCREKLKRILRERGVMP